MNLSTEVLQQPPEKEQIDILQHLEAIFNDTTFLGKEPVFQEIASIPKQDRYEVLQYVYAGKKYDLESMQKFLQYFQEGTSVQQAKTIEALKDSTAEKRELFIQSFGLLCDCMDPDSFLEAIKALRGVLNSKDVQIIASISNFCREKALSDGFKIREIIKTILHLPKKEREEFLQDFSVLYDERITGECLASLLEELKDVPKEKRAFVAAYVKKYYPFQEEYPHAINGRYEMVHFARQHEEIFLENASELFHNRTRTSDRMEILRSLDTIAVEDQRDIITYTKSLQDIQIGKEGTSSIIDALFYMEKAMRKNAVDTIMHALQKRKGIHSAAIAAMLSSMHLVSKKEQKEFFDDACLFLENGYFSEKGTSSVIVELLNCRTIERKSIIEYINKYTRPNDNLFAKYTLLTFFNKESIKRTSRKRAIEFFNLDMPLEDKMVLIKAINNLLEKEQAAILHDVKRVVSSLSCADIVMLIATFRYIPEQERRATIAMTLPVFTENISNATRAHIIAAAVKVDENIREKAILCMNKLGLFNEKSLKIISKNISAIGGVLKRDPEIIPYLDELIHDFMEVHERISLFNAFRNVPKECQDSVLKNLRKVCSQETGYDDKLNVLYLMNALSQEERETLVDTFTASSYWKEGLKKRVAYAVHPLILFYILPPDAKEKAFSLVQMKSLSGVQEREVLFQAVLKNLYEQELSNNLCSVLENLIINHMRWLGIHEEDPFTQEFINLYALRNIKNEKNPFSIYKKLQNLSLIPTTFQPQKRDVCGRKVSINMQQLAQMQRKISREELSKEVTFDVWDTLRKDLKKKIEENPDAVQHLSFLGTTWVEIEKVLFQDTYLTGLLEISGEPSEVEVKWRAILESILKKSVLPVDGVFFLEQQEALIKILMGIQHCSGGKAVGIHSTYALLENIYHYQVQGPQTIEAYEEQEGKKKVFCFLQEFLKQYGIVTLKKWNESIIQYVNSDTATHSGILRYAIGDYTFWDANEDDMFYLNEAGAKRLLEIFQEDLINMFKNKMAEVIRTHIENQLNGTSAFSCTLNNQEEMEHPAHLSIYLKNLIGRLVGVSWQVVFDRHTNVFSAELLKISREEVLEKLFQYVTPESIIKEFMRCGYTQEDLLLLKLLFDDEKYWDNGKLSSNGILELLCRTGYCIE